VPSPSRKRLSLKVKRNKPTSDHLSLSQSRHRARRDQLSLSQSLSKSAPTTLRSVMSCRTLDDSLGGLDKGERPLRRGPPGNKRGSSVSFSKVNVREYERILGDNPCVSSGVPIGIGWRYAPAPVVMDVDDYEDGRTFPRGRAEYMLPKRVREGMVQEHAGVRRREMVAAVRSVQKAKAQRQRTVINLGRHRSEARVEGAKRKLKKILWPSPSSAALQSKLWNEAHAAALEKAQRLEDSLLKGESVSMRSMYSVGNPRNNVLPSRRSSSGNSGAETGHTWQPRRSSLPVVLGAGQGGNLAPAHAATIAPTHAAKTAPGEHLPSSERAPKQCAVDAIDAKSRPMHRSRSDGALETHGRTPSRRNERRFALRRSAQQIVASESEIEEIFAKLLLDESNKAPCGPSPPAV